jgi:putative sterol carrier protein
MTGRNVIEKKIADKLKNNPEQAESIGEKVAVILTGHDGGRWVLDCSKNPATVEEDNKTKVQTTITMSSENLVKLSKGEMNGVSAFMFGKIKVDGDLGIAVKLGKVLS